MLGLMPPEAMSIKVVIDRWEWPIAESERVIPGSGIIGTGDRLLQCANIVGVCSTSTGRPECVSRASRREPLSKRI
jgi:hypothetical protein